MISQEAELDDNSTRRDMVHKNTKLKRHKTQKTRLKRQAQDAGRQRSRGECRITLSSPRWTRQRRSSLRRRCGSRQANDDDYVHVTLLLTT
jgi:hypothetical protein